MILGQKSLDAVILATAAIAALALMLPTLGTGFLSDDFLDLHHDFSAASFTRFEFTGFRPLTEAIFAMDAGLWGARHPWGWHLTNLVLHFLCAFLFWRVALRLSGDSRRAAIAAAFFLVSFAAVPSFARVSGRTAPASMAPFIAAILFHSRYASGRNPADLIAGLVLFLVSLFTKETALLCVPVFGLVSIHLGASDRRGLRTVASITALYLIPAAIYIAWRLYWLGFELGYSESERLGFFMVTNLLTLLRMPFSPWLDGIPLRMLALLAFSMLFFVRCPWRTRLMMLSLLLLPIATVANLPPRSYYAYACLPGAALIFGSAAGSVRGRIGGLLISLALLGCFLSARDELSRFRLADAYTQRTIRVLDSLEASSPEGSLIFPGGIEEQVAGYGTIWSGAYGEALSTIGGDGSRMFEQESFWEECWPLVDAGEEPATVFARLSGAGYETLVFDPAARFESPAAPDSAVLPYRGRIRLTPGLLRMNSCSSSADTRLYLPDPFEQQTWIEIEPFAVTDESAVFDLENTPGWLLADPDGCGLLVQGGRSGVVFSGERLWLEPLRERLAVKESNLQ